MYICAKDGMRGENDSMKRQPFEIINEKPYKRTRRLFFLEKEAEKLYVYKYLDFR
ncbi:MAG: hypothetical protein H6Q41_440 [Deltaproteobacteria bacterium]|jgi:hypothetical protein|nr:hypothetical protein [Deltaproteobacteria bacterium]